MKRILIVATGGTIGSSFIDGCRRLNADVAKSTLLKNFAESGSRYAPLGTALFEDSYFELKTLSENMTPQRLLAIADHIRDHREKDLSGIIVLHGTDTLAFSSSMLSMLFCDIRIPMILVSGNRPPNEAKSNANANFQAAVELICGGIAPNIYAVYRNSDDRIYLHIGSTLLQCADRSEDLLNASEKNMLLLDENNDLPASALARCRELSEKRRTDMGPFMNGIEKLDADVLLIKPYVGLDYSRYDLDGIGGVVHGTYHSGTVCVDDEYERLAVSYLCKRCASLKIPVYVAPCKLDKDQYESAYKAESSGIRPLNFTVETAYCKLLIGVSAGLSQNDLCEFMQKEINGELLDQ